MPAPGWSNLGLKTETVEQLKAFQIFAISKTGKMYNLSETVELAIAIASKHLEEEQHEEGSN